MPDDDNLCRWMVESWKRHEWFVGTYTSSVTRNGKFLLVNSESCRASWSGFNMKYTNNRCEWTGSNLCQYKMQSAIPK